jgi:hypothetical protein
MTNKPTLVQFAGRRPPEGPLPNEDVLQQLAELVPLAQAGHIRSLAIAYTSPDNETTTWCHEGDGTTLLGAVQMLSTELALSLLQEDE